MLLMRHITGPSTASSPDAPDWRHRTPQHEAFRAPKAPRRKRRKTWARRSAPGAPPGTLLPNPEAPSPVIHVIAYGPDACTEQPVESPALVRAFLQAWPVTWVNVEGLGDATVIRQLGDLFGLHRLALEDVINVHQRAKVEQYSDHHFIVTRMVRLGERLERDSR